MCIRDRNKAVPSLLKKFAPVGVGGTDKDKKKTKGEKGKDVVKFSYISPSSKEKRYVSINKEDKKSFLKDLKVSESGLVGLKRDEEKVKMVNKPSYVAHVSNKLFSGVSDDIAKQVKDVGEDLKKANMHFLLSTYVSIALFISLCVFVLSLVVFVFLTITGILSWIYFWIPFLACFLTLAGFYFYPHSEKQNVRKMIVYELPFAAIHMAAIAGSDVEPTKIFRIIAMSKEYPHIGAEVRKVINQVEIYGYDLVTALKNVARQTSSKALGDLLSGLATNISSGGELKSYLEKKAENYMVDYRLRGERYSSLAGTFMDIYISVLIAAPLVLMMMFVIMNVAGIGVALSINSILLISVTAVVVVNIIFLVVLNWKQPRI